MKIFLFYMILKWLHLSENGLHFMFLLGMNIVIQYQYQMEKNIVSKK